MDVLKKHGTTLKKHGESLKKQVQEKTQEFVENHPDEIAKARSTATNVLNTTQKQVDKGAEKLNISTTFKLPGTTTTTATATTSTNSTSNSSTATTTTSKARVPAPEPTVPEEEVEEERTATTDTTPSAVSAAAEENSHPSSLGKEYVSIELNKEEKDAEQQKQGQDEEEEEKETTEEVVVEEETTVEEDDDDETVQVKEVEKEEEEAINITTTTMSTSEANPIPRPSNVESSTPEEEEPSTMIRDREGDEEKEQVGQDVDRTASTAFEYPSPLSKTVASVNAAKHEEKDGQEDAGATDDGSGGSDDGSDSEDWEDSGDESWPTSTTRYAPVGDSDSRVSNPKGTSRLATEFTLGAGFHHLNSAGSAVMFAKSAGGEILPCGPDHKLVHYNTAALELMKANTLVGKGLKVSKSAYLDKVLLITDAPHAIRLYIGDEDGPCIVGMALIRDDIIFTSGILSEKYMKPLTLQLDIDEPVLASIELQCCTFLEGGGGRVEKKISYMMLRGGGGGGGDNTIVFGQVHEEGFDGKSSIYSKVESATGNLCISGIGYFDNKPISLQIVDLGNDCDDVVDAMDTCVYYNNGVISGNLIRSRMKEVEFLNSITTENDAVWDVLEGCMDAVENSSPSYGELLPNAINLFETALGGDAETIHSVMRMDRYLTHIIQEKKTVGTFDNDHLNFYAKLIPMKQMWGIFSNTIERIKRITNTQPELNSFSVAFLQGTDEFFMQAIFIFLTQAALLILTISHIWVHRSEAFHIPSPLRFIVAICGTIVVNFMAKQSKNNFEDFETIFPEYVGSTLYKLDAFSNIVGGKLVTLSTLVLLMMTDDNLDIVLNATALLFVLELDECLVDTNPIWVTGVYRAYFMKDVLRELQISDSRYWDPEYLRKDRGQHYRLHLPSCSLLFPQNK